jgi:arrestin-related trafficking adapter 3/6
VLIYGFLERVDYYSDFRRAVRTDTINRHVLLALKDPHKHHHHILPLESDDIEAFKRSAMYNGADSDEELSATIANLMGPGPWHVQKDLRLPKSCNELHFTNKNKKSNIVISHTLKVIFRVQRGDDQEMDKVTGKRKMFDIVVQSPINILSVRYTFPEFYGIITLLTIR